MHTGIENLTNFIATALTVRFDNETYTAYENDGMVQLVLVLSDPSPFAETVQVMNTDITADGMVNYVCKYVCTYVSSLYYYSRRY